MRLAAGLTCLALAALTAAGPAAAFTVEPVSPSGSGGNAPLADPGEFAPMQRLTTDPNGTPAYKFGDSGLSFSLTGRNGSTFPHSGYYLDPSQPPSASPYLFGRSPLDAFPR